MTHRRWPWTAAALALLVILAGLWLVYSSPVQVARGIFWQPDTHTLHPHGIWNQIGVTSLVVQYGSVDNKAWFNNAYLPPAKRRPDWQRIRHEPWARRIIMGMSGDYDEPTARHQVDYLVHMSKLLFQHLPVPATAYYFPVEADPTWRGVDKFGRALRDLPRPLWISVYTRHRIAPQALASWVQQWLPKDVGVMLQDGVGVGDRKPQQAQALLRGLQKRLGKRRVAMIAEMFRLDHNGALHSAPIRRIIKQLHTYRGDQIYLYEGPHDLPAWKVWLIKLWFKLNAR